MSRDVVVDVSAPARVDLPTAGDQDVVLLHGPQRLRIAGGVKPHDVQVEIGGVRVEHAISGLTLTHGYRRLPTLTLELAVSASDVTEDAVTVVMPEATRDLLVRAGWTPPTTPVGALEGDAPEVRA